MTFPPTLIQSVAHPPRRDVTQPGSYLPLPTVPVQAAPFPHPCVNSLPRAATGVDGSEPSALSFDPAFLAATRETQYGPNDMEAL